MNDAEIDRVLVETWDDQRLSRAERRALKEVVEDARRPEDERQRFRHRAFALAAGFMAEAAAVEVLDWLEEVVRALWPSEEAKPAVARSEAHFSPDGEIVERLVALFDAADHQVDVCVFTITDDRVAKAMARAWDRGVKIRLLTDDDKALDLGSDIDRLAGLGMPVRVDRTEYHMHHKFALFDGARLVNGSYNWTRSANEHNFENIAITADADLLRAFTAEFERLWERAAKF